MKRKSTFQHNHIDKGFSFRWRLRRRKSIQFPDRGFTLIELLVAGVIGTIVILVMWSGLVSAMNMSQEAQARSARESELNKALDFMTNEIRMARSINASSTLTANGTTVTLPDVITSAGVNLANLGNYGTLGLYLERPTAPNIPAICPVGGPNAGAPPPTPADFDPIVYDIRPSPSGWLQPKMLARYGRLPAADGTIDPCSSPLASDPMVDALAATRTPPPCTGGVLSGNGGFYTCVIDKQTDLYFQSAVSNVGAKQISSSAASRLMNFVPSSSSILTLTAIPIKPHEIDVSWVWSGSGSVSNYEIHTEWDGSDTVIYTGTGTAISKFKISFASVGDRVCFLAKAQTASSATVDSNRACVIR